MLVNLHPLQRFVSFFHVKQPLEPPIRIQEQLDEQLTPKSKSGSENDPFLGWDDISLLRFRS